MWDVATKYKSWKHNFDERTFKLQKGNFLSMPNAWATKNNSVL